MNSEKIHDIRIDELSSDELYDLGRMYEFGKGVEEDHHKAAELYIKAAGMGYKKAKDIFFFDFDKKEMVNTDPRRVKTLAEAAELGYADAQYSLGGRYRGGVGMRKNYEKAFYWFTKAAEHEHAEAAYYLAAMYRKGRATKVDLFKAKELTEKAASLGCAPAQHMIGKLLLSIPGREKKAVAWIRLAASNGYRIAEYDYGIMHLNGSLEESDPQEGFGLLSRSAGKGYAVAAYKIGEILEHGLYGFEKNMAEAIRWYEKSERLNYVGADLRLAKIYQNGEGVEKDLMKCINYYKMADKRGWHYARGMMMEIFTD